MSPLDGWSMRIKSFPNPNSISRVEGPVKEDLDANYNIPAHLPIVPVRDTVDHWMHYTVNSGCLWRSRLLGNDLLLWNEQSGWRSDQSWFWLMVSSEIAWFRWNLTRLKSTVLPILWIIRIKFLSVSSRMWIEMRLLKIRGGILATVSVLPFIIPYHLSELSLATQPFSLPS